MDLLLAVMRMYCSPTNSGATVTAPSTDMTALQVLACRILFALAETTGSNGLREVGMVGVGIGVGVGIALPSNYNSVHHPIRNAKNCGGTQIHH